jgi:hypothetical protein
MPVLFILNLTQGSFFRYQQLSEDDTNYNKILLQLLTPPKKSGLSHWDRKDHIIFVPPHLYDHVNKFYNELYNIM